MSKLNNQSFNLMKALEENEQIEIKKKVIVDSYHEELLESVDLTEERLGNNTFTDKDEAEYYRNKELYHQSGLERHKEAMDKAKEACKNKGIEVDETEGVYESCNKNLKEERVHRNPDSDPNAEDKFVKKEDKKDKKSGYVIFVKDDSNGYSYQGIGGRSRVRLDMIDDLDIYDTVEQAQKEVNTYKNPKKIKIMKFDGKNATELNESCNKEELKEDEDTSKEERLASLKTQLEVDGDQLADDEKEAIQNEINQLENELNEEGAIDANSEVVTEEDKKISRMNVHKDVVSNLGNGAIKLADKYNVQMNTILDNVEDTIVENSNLFESSLTEEYSEKLGGDPEDFVSDCQSILEILNGIDTESFGTHLAQQMIEEWIETAESQIRMTKSRYNLKEAESWDNEVKKGLRDGWYSDGTSIYAKSIDDLLSVIEFMEGEGNITEREAELITNRINQLSIPENKNIRVSFPEGEARDLIIYIADTDGKNEEMVDAIEDFFELEEDEKIETTEETLEDAINRAHEEEISAIETYDAVLGKTDESTDAKLIEMINEIKADEEDHKLLLQHYIETGEALSDDELEALKNSEESTEEVPVEEPIEESENRVAEEKVTNLKEVKSQGNIFMLQDDSKFFVGENYVEAEGLLENAEIYENKEEADKDYLSRCEITKDGKPANIE